MVQDYFLLIRELFWGMLDEIHCDIRGIKLLARNIMKNMLEKYCSASDGYGGIIWKDLKRFRGCGEW